MSNRKALVAATAVVIVLFVVLSVVQRSSARDGKSQAVTFTNPQSIAINTSAGLTAPTTASLYPSTINVSGMTGTITKVEVTLKGVSHTRLNDMDFLLVGPTGAKYVFLSDAGSFIPADDRVYTIKDDAASTFADDSGSYRPTSGDVGADTFPAPAPAGPYSQPPGATFASVFNGTDPNGLWALYAVDDNLGAPGEINSGWVITITTNGAPASFGNNSYIGLNDATTPASPYGSAINVSGLSGVISRVTVTLNGLTHSRPEDIDVLLVSPGGKGLILMSDVGAAAASNTILTFDDAAPTVINTVTSGTYKPTDYIFEGTDTFPSPAPLRPYLQSGALLNNFNGSSPNGEWRLFVVDDLQLQSGSISGGWSIDITTVPAPPPITPDCALPIFSTTNFSAGTSPTGIAVADFNGDNKADVAVANQVSNNVSILLGSGTGSFGPQSLIGVGSSPYAIAAGRFNPDNFYDLAVANSGSNNVSILLGNGNGTFSAPVNFVAGPTPISLAVGDVNNDSKQDILVANFGSIFAGSVSVLLGNGSGGFAATNSVRTRTQPSFVYMTNLDGDANKDLIVANFGSNSVSTFFGSGSGTFQLNQNISTAAGPVAIEVADIISSGGIPDLIVANYNGDSVTTCLGNANGNFSSCGNNTGFGPNPISVVAGNFTGGNVASFIVALSGSSLIRSNFLTDANSGQNPNALGKADFNGDGKVDIVSANSGSNDVSVLLNICQVAKGNYFDFNGDRRTDYGVFRPSNASWWIQSLSSSNPTFKFGRPGDKPVPADYNGDTKVDPAYYRSESGLWFVLDQNSRPIYFQQFGLPEDVPVPADFDGDGKADIAVWRPSQGTWYVRRSTDNSVFIAQWGVNGDKPVPADYDGDGKDDFAVYRPANGVWYIYRSSNNQVDFRQFGTAEDRTVQGDYDGDGKADVAVWRPSTGIWYVLRSSDGDFRAALFGVSTDIPLVGDYDGDGKYDYAVWRPSDGYWYVWKSSDNSPMFVQWGTSGDAPLPGSLVR